MANHVRRQIRDAVATALTGLATTGTRVFPSRTQVLQDANLPGLRVYTQQEDVLIGSIDASRLQERTLTLLVEGVAKVNDTLDDTLDQIAKEVEVALDAAQGAGGAKYLQLTNTDIEMNAEGEQDTGTVRLTYEVLYITATGAPDVAL